MATPEETLAEYGAAVHEFRQYLKRKEEEEKKAGGAAPETKEALEKLQDALDKVEELKTEKAREREAMDSRIRDVEAKLARSAQLPDDPDPVRLADDPELVKAMEKYWRRGEKGLNASEEAILSKALATDSGADGGYTVYPTVDNNVRQKLIEISPVRKLARVETIAGGEWQGPAEGSQQFDSGWVGERQARPETNAAQLRIDIIKPHEMYAKPRATQTMLDDAGFGVESWLTARVTREFDRREGNAFILGDSVGKPEGLLTNADIAYVPGTDASAIKADGMIDLFYALPEFYARNASWLLKRSTIRDVRKLKETSTDNYLWQPGLASGQPNTILDRPYEEAFDMPAIAANAFPVLFGDFKEGYLIVDRIGMRVLRDPYSAKPLIEFYTTKRVGGGVIMAEALRKLKIATS